MKKTFLFAAIFSDALKKNGFEVEYYSHTRYGISDFFAKYLAYGITFSIAFQTILNLMVVIGLIPVTGVTLPFLSYGGSSLLVSMIEVGILLNISK